MRTCTVSGARQLALVERERVAALGPGEVRVAYATGGICGSDLHYYFDGGVGDFRLREPLILGHEVAGTVTEVGDDVSSVRVGQGVAVDPNLPCLACRECLAGRTNLCREMTFFGSAAVTPHVQGGWREELVVPERQAVGLPGGTDPSIAAFAEPLAVCLHAASRAGPVAHREVLVTGCGPIGCLAVAALKLAGASRVVAADVAGGVLEHARALGADETIDLSADPKRMAALRAGRGTMDAALECSGAPRALAACIEAVRPGGTVVQTGMLPAGDNPVPVNRVVAKELAVVGTFRFHDEFRIAVDALARGRIDPRSLLTGTFDFADADAAFEAARDRARHMKVQLRFDHA